MILLKLSIGEWIAISAVLVAILASIIIPLLILVFRSGGLFERVDNIKDTIDEMKPDVKMIPVIKEKIDVLWATRFTTPGSPLVLTDKGKKVLKDSKIEKFTNEYFNEILEQVKKKNYQNAYQAQEALISIVREYKNKHDCKNKLENAAFIAGVDVDSVLLVAAINIRNRIIKELHFKIDDIDKYDPSKK